MKHALATDNVMPTAQDTLQRNPMQPPADSPNSARGAVLTFMRQPSPLLIVLLSGVLMAVRLALGPWHWLDTAIVVGMWAYFPFNEWLIHVVVLHYKPKTIGRYTIDFYLPKTHRRHHADPWNLDWVLVPLHVHLWVGIAMTLILVVAGSWRAPLATGMLTYVLLGLHYEWVHFLAHITWCPPLAYYQQLVRAHRYHHFRNEKLLVGSIAHVCR